MFNRQKSDPLVCLNSALSGVASYYSDNVKGFGAYTITCYQLTPYYIMFNRQKSDPLVCLNSALSGVASYYSDNVKGFGFTL